MQPSRINYTRVPLAQLNRTEHMRNALVTSLPALALACTMVIAACGSDQIAHDVAYVLGGEGQQLFMLTQAGESSKIVNKAVTDPKWSPNQRRIAFLTDYSNGTGQLMIWDRETEDDTRVPDAPATVSRYFWSPDSRMITYQAETQDGAKTEVYVHNFEEDETTLLVTEPSGNVELGNWSGDNKWVLMRLDVDGGHGIYMRSVEGVNEVQLTDYEDHRPRFSLDGKRVALARTQPDGSTDIHMLMVDTGDGPSAATQLTDDDGDETDFEWAPNGRDIVYVSERDGNAEVYSIDTDDKSTRRLTQNRIQDADPRWSIDGDQILFRSDIDGKNHIFSMDFKSGSQTRVLEEDSDIVIADW